MLMIKGMNFALAENALRRNAIFDVFKYYQSTPSAEFKGKKKCGSSTKMGLMKCEFLEDSMRQFRSCGRNSV